MISTIESSQTSSRKLNDSAMDCLKSILVLAALLALAGYAVASKEYKINEYCAYVDAKTLPNAEGWASASSAYESAMVWVRSLLSQAIEWRRHLADGWRAVTFDEPCGPKSLTYVSTIYACQPGQFSTQQFLASDVHKYARKCLTPEYLEEKFEAQTRANPTGLESFLTSDLLAAYRRANPDEPAVHFSVQMGGNCCQPRRAHLVLVEAMSEKFPQETAKFRLETDEAFKRLGKFLNGHLYKPCASYTKRFEALMKGAEAAAHYVLNVSLAQLSPASQDAIFRYKFCQNLKTPTERERFNQLMVRTIR